MESRTENHSSRDASSAFDTTQVPVIPHVSSYCDYDKQLYKSFTGRLRPFRLSSRRLSQLGKRTSMERLLLCGYGFDMQDV